ncbi:Ig-like domain-containing protein [Photobacterium leiognathi]|uniref:Ig-like domain-containing protein n=1 Tax=Photobacterium leiognathi TaxID=553611 RepID=UPI002982A9FE|nr:Ig-like domain-containing protein [Photobacterium leiognathi]
MIFLLIIYREYQFNILTPNHEKSLSSIKISAIFSIDGDSEVSLYKGDKLSLIVEGIYSDDSKSPLKDEVKWHLSSEDTATINNKGILTGINSGNVEIKAYYKGIESNIIRVNVIDVVLSSIKISVDSASYTTSDVSTYKGGKLSLIAEGIYSDGLKSLLTNEVQWHLSIEDIAKINNKGILTGINSGNVELKASYKGIESNIINVSINEAVLSSINISIKSMLPDASDASIHSGGQLLLAAEGVYSDGSTSPLTNGLKWHSSTLDIAQINDKGVLTGVNTGGVEVKASYQGIESNIINVSITDAILSSINISIKSMSSDASNTSIYRGDKLSLAAEGIYSDGSTSPLTNEVKWHSSAVGIAQIDDKGVLTGIHSGNVDVKASYEGIESNIINVSITNAVLPSIVNTKRVEVKAPYEGIESNIDNASTTDTVLSSINISIKSMSPDASGASIYGSPSIYSGGQLSLAAEGVYSDGSTLPLTNKVTWHSSAVDIVQIDDKGILTGVNTGGVEVKASYKGIESRIINVRITDAILTSMKISVKSLSPDTSKASIYSGGQLSLTAEGIYSDGSTSPLTNKVTWHSSAIDIAQIDDKGILTGLNTGSLDVKASYEGIESNIINVRITDAILSSIAISVKSLSPDVSIYSGGQLSFAAEGIYSDGSTSPLTNKVTWRSSAVDIAQIDDKGILTGLNTGSVQVKASYEGIESNIINVSITDAILTSMNISVKSLSSDASEASIYSGGQLSFAAEGIYSDGSTSPLTNKVTWYSSAVDIAQIDDKGILTGVSTGTIDVKASYEGIESNIINVRITDAILSSMNISVKSLSPDASIYSGGQLSFTAEGTYSDGSTSPLTNKVTWHSSAVDIAQIDDKGILTGINTGTVEVKASYEGIESNIIKVRITDAILTSMNISVKSLSSDASIYSGGQLPFAAEGIYSDGSTSTLTNKVTWHSSAVDIAHIDDKGILTGINTGTVEVEASYEGIESNIINVRITDAILSSMNISVKSLSPDASETSIYSGGQLSFTAEGIYSDGSTLPLTNKVTWHSSAIDVAQIDDKGILTGVSTGTIDVKASYEGIESNIINVRITDAILSSMNISVKSLSPDASIYSGGQLSFTAEGTYSDGSTSPLTNKVTWHSSAVDIAQIDDKGILTGINTGTVEVKASYEGIESNIINVRITDAILTSMNISVKSLSSDASIYSGGQLPFAAEGIYSDGSTSTLTNKVTWHSSAVDIAHIDDKGILTGVAIGTVEVKASYEDIESNIINVRITDAILTSMNISVKSLSSEASIYSGGQLSFAAEGIYSDGSTSPLTNKATWHSSAVDIAQIDDKGILTGVAIGTVAVKASYEGIESNIINVRITDAILSSITISVKSLSPDASIYSGGQLSFAAEGIYSDGSTSPLTNKVTWHSSAIDIAQIDDKGILTGLNTGTVEVKASYEGIESNIINVTITDAILLSLEATPAIISVPKGVPINLKVNATLSDSSIVDVTKWVDWSHSSVADSILESTFVEYEEGKYQVIASLQGIHSNVVDITVTEAEVVSILITPKTDLTVYRNDPLQLTAIGTYTDGSEQNITTTAEWHSNEPGIIAVTNKGLANYIKDGEAPIYASVGTVRSNVISINGVSLSFSYELDTNGIFSLDALNNSVLRLVPELSSPSGLEIHKTAYVTNYIDEKFTYTITPEPANELSYIQLKKDAHIRLRIPDKDEYLQLPWIRMLPFLGQMTIYDTYTNADTSFKDWGAEELKIRAYSTTLEKRANTLAQPLFEIELNNDITVPIVVKKTKEVDPDKTYTLAIKTYDERDYIKLNYKPMRSSNRLDSLYLLGFGIEGESSEQVSFKVVLIDNEHNSMECGEYTLRPVVGTEITVPSFMFNGKECILINK